MQKREKRKKGIAVTKYPFHWMALKMTLGPHNEGWKCRLQLEEKISFDLSHHIALDIVMDSYLVITSSG